MTPCFARNRPARLAAVLGVLCCALTSACEKASNEAPVAPMPCKEVGQRCEYAPGKLGACVLRDGCRGDGCFVCQSQH